MDYDAVNESLVLVVNVETFETTPRECVFVNIINDNVVENLEEFALNLSFNEPVAEYISQLLVIIEGRAQHCSKWENIILGLNFTL